jgi:acyl-CoA synthetase (AMP-forming)/AMP-acid ligase II
VPLRFARSCSAPLDVSTGQAMERMLGAPLLSAYGMTETSHQAATESQRHSESRKPGSVGQARGVDIRIVDNSGHTCPAGTVGEVWVGGPTVARGYLAAPSATAESFADGWFRTGDLGSLDVDGCLFVTGRIKNIINYGGEKISPEHVEAVLVACSDVTEAAVFAIPDAMYGERVGAAVVCHGNSVTAEEILRACRSELSRFEVPDRIEVVAALPHTAKGALDRRAVSDIYAVPAATAKGL